MSDQATDEDVAELKRRHVKLTSYSECAMDSCTSWPCPTAKLLARLERVERELAQTEKECENALAALAGEPYPYPEVRRKK